MTTMMDAPFAFYIRGESHLQDVAAARADGIVRSWCRGLTLEEYRTEENNPAVECLPIEEAMRLCDEGKRAKYAHGPKRTDAASFGEMLNILPPVRWTRRGSSESFLMSERTCGSLTTIFARVGEDFYVLCDECTLTHDQIVAKVRQVASHT